MQLSTNAFLNSVIAYPNLGSRLLQMIIPTKKIIVSLIIPVVCLLYACSSESQDNKTISNFNELNGPIKSMTSILYVAREEAGKIKKSRVLEKQVKKFDKKGNLVESIWHSPETGDSEQYVFKYDEKGTRVERLSYDEERSVQQTRHYHYDENGLNKMYQDFNRHGNLISKVEFIFNDEGQIIERKRLDSSDAILSKVTKKYDKNKLITKWIIYDAEGVLRNKISYDYSIQSGYKEQYFIAKDSVVHHTTFLYEDFDNHNNWLMEKQYYENDELRMVTIREIEYY